MLSKIALNKQKDYILISNELIKYFRDFINKNNDYLTLKYSNINGKNQWSLICSCIDWIDVAIDYVTNMNLESDNINVRSMLAYSYISAIDIIWESVIQLHRVLISKSALPFKSDFDIFPKVDYIKDDNEYFKHIRSVFGAHPVNLNKKGKWFACWPNDTNISEYDFTVILYNSDIDSDDKLFGYRFEELSRFLISRYNYLNDIIKSIEEQINKFIKQQQKNIIPKKGSNVEQLEILLAESHRRFNNQYYNSMIEDLLVIFQTNSSNSELYNNYLEKCKVLINKISQNLQTMQLNDIDEDYILYPKSPSKISYPVSKLYDYFHSGRNVLVDYHINEVNDFFKGSIRIKSEMTSAEIFTLIKVGLYFYNYK